jgi:hypothetical protein
MRAWCSFVSVMSLVMVLGGTVEAVTLFSGELNPGQTNSVFCSVVNTSRNTINEVRFDFLYPTGILVIGSTSVLDIEPGQSGGAGVLPSAKSVGIHCRITFVGSKNEVRAVFSVHDDTAGTLVAIPVE